MKENLNAEQKFLKTIVGRKLSKEKAGQLATKIKDHKWYMSESLHRDVGVKVAAIDYLENISPSEIISSPPQNTGKIEDFSLVNKGFGEFKSPNGGDFLPGRK